MNDYAMASSLDGQPTDGNIYLIYIYIYKLCMYICIYIYIYMRVCVCVNKCII